MLRTYDGSRDWLSYLHDAYWGGERWRSPSSPVLGTAHVYELREVQTSQSGEGEATTRDIVRPVITATERTYLVPHDGESAAQFRRRMALAAYVNLVQPVVDTYADSVTGRVKRDLGELGPYVSNLDGQGAAWAEHVEEVARWAAAFGMYATVFDAPRTNPAQSRADEQRQGVGLRAISVPPTAWAWIDVDADGCVEEFAYVDAPYRTLDAQEEVCLWRWTRTGWERHEVRRGATLGGAPRTFGDLRPLLSADTCKESGALPATILGTVPVVFAYYRRDTSVRWPQGVSLVADAADLCRQVFNLLSSAEEQIRKTAFAFLAVPTASKGGDLPVDVTLKLGSDSALPHPAEAGPPQWIQPRSETTQEIRAHAVFLLALVLRLAGLEATTTADGSKGPESGVALRIRSRGFEARAAKFAGQMARYETRALGLCARMLGMDAGAAAAAPTITYPTRYTLPDSSEDLDRAITVLREVATRLGPEGVIATVRQALDAALSLSEAELERLVEEVRARMAAAAAAAAAAEAAGGADPASASTGGAAGHDGVVDGQPGASGMHGQSGAPAAGDGPSAASTASTASTAATHAQDTPADAAQAA